MPRRRKALLLLALGLFVCGLFVVLNREKEPSYKGKYLSEWITIQGSNYASHPYIITSQSRKQEAADAIRHIATKALPFLLAWMDEPAEWRLKLVAASRKLPQSVAQSRPVIWLLSSGDSNIRARQASTAFVALGPIAAPAIPELTRRANLTNSPGKATLALLALAGIGPEGARAITNILSGPLWVNSDWPIQFIPIMGTNALPLVPLIVQRHQSTNASIKFQSTVMLRMLSVDPDRVIPALIAALKDPSSVVQFNAAASLGEFGKLARPALPALSNILNNPDPDLRRTASNSIWRITTAPGINTPPR